MEMKENWISIEDEKVKQSDELDTANTTRDDVLYLILLELQVIQKLHSWLGICSYENGT